MESIVADREILENVFTDFICSGVERISEKVYGHLRVAISPKWGQISKK